MALGGELGLQLSGQSFGRPGVGAERGVNRALIRRRWAIVVIPALAALGWAVYVRWRLGWPASDIEEFTPVPLWGYVDAYRRVAARSPSHSPRGP